MWPLALDTVDDLAVVVTVTVTPGRGWGWGWGWGVLIDKIGIYILGLGRVWAGKVGGALMEGYKV